MISVTDVNLGTENSPVSSFPNLNSSILSTIDYSITNGSVHRHEEFIEIFEVPVGIVAFLSVCYGAVSLVAVIGNACVLWVVASRRRMRTVTNYFISNLALADIVIGLFAVPFQFQAALLQKWLLPAFLCAFCPFVQVLSVNVSVFTLTAIAFDRYRAVLHPLKRRGTSKLSAKLTILGIWLVGAIAAAPYVAAFRVTSVFNPETGDYTRPFCTNTRISPTVWGIYNYLLATLQYALPLCLISFAYGRMALRLRGNGGFIKAPRDEVILKNKKKVIKMLAIVVALFAVCWLPFQTYNVLQEVLPQINEYKYINVIWFSAHWLAMSNSCYNPFIYAIYNVSTVFYIPFFMLYCC
ncbi:tachykinin-like peptides receptor 99D [Stegodyphus dumicola]|uniref:tachykinin-like peptides receptor 99D n=1 Tax=Stegodyphus dumicola TaxID=202533 RepID=UPI0015AFFC61|nr:tachykinin-like peptides receptor 99D [Stegodyphus dumicola]